MLATTCPNASCETDFLHPAVFVTSGKAGSHDNHAFCYQQEANQIKYLTLTTFKTKDVFFSSKVAKIGKLCSYETAQYIPRAIMRSHAAFEFRDRSVINKLLYVLQKLTMKILEFYPF